MNPVKSGRREQSAQATRRRIREAARELFVSQGYGATSIAAIAEAADVAVQTIYAVYVNKRSLLKDVIDVAIVGDEEPAPITERESFQAIFEATSGLQMLELAVTHATSLLARAADVIEVAYSAASVDPDIAEGVRLGDEARMKNQRRMAAALAERGFLRDDIDEVYAHDMLWAFLGPPTYRQLVTIRGWSTDRYRDWATETLATLLLHR